MDIAVVVEKQVRAALAERPEDPRLQMELGMSLLRQGRYAEGFPMLRARRRVPELVEKELYLPFPSWSGEDLGGKRFLVASSEGYGDQIMFARFMPLLQDLGAEVYWLCPAELARLAQHCLGVHAVSAVGEIELSGFDFFANIVDLAGHFFPPLVKPPSTPYLRSPTPSKCPGLTIGVCTHGNPKHQNDANRSLPGSLRGELLAIPGAVDLKPENTGARDFHDTAQIVAGLDLVVTVDTAVAHLAGAMGKPVWILIPSRDTDWRWTPGRDDSDWYPTARLFWQGADEDWRVVLQKISEALTKL